MFLGMDLSQPDITLYGLKYRVTLSIVVQKKTVKELDPMSTPLIKAQNCSTKKSGFLLLVIDSKSWHFGRAALRFYLQS